MSATLPCPHCGQSTESLKRYRLPTFLLFLGIGASFKHGLLVRCPPCMRKELGRLTLINILPANLLWIVLLLPWYGIAALRSFTQGHSKGLSSGGMPSYRQPDRPVGSPMGKPWHDDPALRPFFRADAPDQLDVLFEYPDGQREHLSAQLISREGNAYIARLLRSSQVRADLAVNTEIRVRATGSSPPLTWFPRVEAPPGLGAQAETIWKYAFMGITAFMVFAVAAAGYSSESAGVAMSYPAAAMIGFFLGGWRAVPSLRETRRPAGLVFAVAFGVAFLCAFAAVVFFEGIFPAL